MAIASSIDWIAQLIANHTVPVVQSSHFQQLRAQALEQAHRLMLPTTAQEEWRFTDLSPLLRLQFKQAHTQPDASVLDVSSWQIPEATLRVTLIDGVFSPEHSSINQLPVGLTILPLVQALDTHGAAIEAHLRKHSKDDDLFVALNNAFLQHGLFIHVAAGVKLTAPIHLLCVARTDAVVTHPRIILIADRESACCVIEDYVSASASDYLTNVMGDVSLAQGAELRHIKVQRESIDAFHVANYAVDVAREAHYISQTMSFGARLSRHKQVVTQNGEAAKITTDGLAWIEGRQLADTHTVMDHSKGYGQCNQAHKTIVGGAAHAVFNGKIFVRTGAQLTDSSQQSRNLLLSPRAHVDTQPQLEIFADDVKCAHGATVGQLDEESLFYLISRGLPELQARNLLTDAFAADLIDRIPVPSLVAQLSQSVMARTGAAS